MEALAPPLRAAFCIRAALENGETTRSAIKSYARGTSDHFGKELEAGLFLFDQKRNLEEFVAGMKSDGRRALWSVLEAGLLGQPIHARLQELEEELVAESEAEVKRFVEALPFKVLIPLFVFAVPAFLALLFGPMVSSLTKGLQ